ncbi:MAG: 50S ribosomal protein L10 [Candidatus Thermoplasmatota archaeon]|jgi:large subunit ribosomal protein L10|nr:50S ribosomal protein L10 [Candidatus Thermoplasmatota archaeon]
MNAHVAKWKYGEVNELVDFITKNKVVGIVEIGKIPALQMQKMRKNLREIGPIKSARNTLISIALDEAEKKVKGISGLKNSITGQTAIITTDVNPFKLFAKIKATRTMAPAKGGEIATHDIEIKAGETPFKPGPIVGELQKVGIPAAIQEGKVVIKSDKLLVKAGEKIPADIAMMLTRLEIYPIEIGMSLHAVFEDGNIYHPDVLDINVDEFIGKIKQASLNSLNLAAETGWVNKFTIKPLLMKAYLNSFNLALNCNIVNKETVKFLLLKAQANMLALKNKTK